MNWINGYTARYSYCIVDPATWKDIEQRGDIIDGSITKVTTGLMESADMTVTDAPSDGEAWVRIYLNATQGNGGAQAALFTGLLQAPATDWHGQRERHKTVLYSVLKPAQDILLDRGWYAGAGVYAASLAAGLLSVVAPVEVDGTSPKLTEPIVAESNETALSMAWKILDAIGWRIRITGDGTITICPKAAEPAVVLDPLENDIIEMDVKDKMDWFSCPNVLRVVSGDMSETARDDDPDSKYSTISRGREIWKEENYPAQNDGESIREYAQRRLKELQSPMRTLSYSRRFLPDVLPGDIVQMHHPAQRIEGNYRVTSQKITLGYGARTSEEAEQHG